ncbi:MAG: TolC family protein [Bryobacterales bacterium]|nr:TolC family protein [Bryobacterales bacterium]
MLQQTAVPSILPALIMLTAFASGAQDRLDLNQLLKQALDRNPEILAAQKRYEAARQRPTQVSSLPDPMISPGFNSNGRPWPGALLGTEPTSNIGVMVSQEIPFPGKRKLAGDMAVIEAAAEFEQYQQAQLSVVSRVKQAYYKLAFAYSATAVIDRNLALLAKFIQIAEARYSAGKAEQQEIFKAQTQMSVLETRRVMMQRERRSREAELNSLVNRPPGAPIDQPTDLKEVALPAELKDLFRSAQENSPMLRRDQKMIQRSEQAVNMARKEFLPDFTLNGGYYNMGRMPDMYMFRADFKVPLYFFRKQRPGVTEQSQLLAQARRTYEATNQSLHYRIQDDYAMAEAAAKLIDIYRKTVIPQAGLTLESSLASYETGKADFLAVLMNSMAVIEYEMNYWEEIQNLHLALVRLEEMTGKRLIP